MTSISLKYTKKITRELLGDVKHKDHMGDQMRKTEQLLYMEKTKFVKIWETPQSRQGLESRESANSIQMGYIFHTKSMTLTSVVNYILSVLASIITPTI